MTEVFIGIVLLLLGVCLGRSMGKDRTEPPRKSQQELQQLQEDRAAFRQLMGYSPERAYGREED